LRESQQQANNKPTTSKQASKPTARE